MSEDNLPKKQRSEIRTRLLTNRGIGKAYHFQSLTGSDNKYAKMCLKALEDYSSEHVMAGRGITTIGKSSEAYDLSVLIARALILMNMEVYVVEFSDLVDKEINYLEFLASKNFPSIFIMNFRPDSVYCDSRDYSRIEAVLRKFYVNDSKPVFFHIPVEYNHAKKSVDIGDLVSENFLDKILEINETLELK